MKRKISFFIFSLASILVLGSAWQVFACSCITEAPACERYGFSDLIFIGKAIDVKNETTAEGYERQSTVFEVEEMFLGTKKDQIVVRNKSGSSCDTAFMPDETYLVFAGGDDKKGYGTGLCSGNTLLTEAQEMLEELRSLPKAGSGGKLFVHVYESLKRSETDNAPMPGVKIKIQEVDGKRKVYSGVTDSEGNYELILPQGKYKLIPAIPAYAELGYVSDDPVFVKDRSCVLESFSVQNKSRISGKVVDSEGNPVARIPVELLSTDRINKPGWLDDDGGTYADDDGSFTIENVPAGKYTLSINYLHNPEDDNPFPTIFYSNSAERTGATVLEIGLGKSVNGLVFRLPPRLTEIEVRGSVVWEDGKQAGNIDLYLIDSEFPRSCVNDCFKTDADGNFVVRGYSTRKYRLQARTDKDIEGETIEYSVVSELFSINDSLPKFKLVLKRSEKKDN